MGIFEQDKLFIIHGRQLTGYTTGCSTDNSTDNKTDNKTDNSTGYSTEYSTDNSTTNSTRYSTGCINGFTIETVDTAKTSKLTGMTLQLLNHMKPFNKQPFIEATPTSVFGIKPNLVCSSPAGSGATTHPEIVEGIIIYLQNNGFNRIKIIESAWVGDSTKRAFKVCGYEELASRYGVELMDLKEDSHFKKEYKNLEISICSKIKEIDYLINVPLIKGHCQTKITCALKNLKGLIPDNEKRRFHSLGLHQPIAFLNKLIRQDLIIADAICPDPYFEEGGSPRQLDMIVGGYDPVLVDSYAAYLLGYKTSDIKYITIAEKEGVGNSLKNSGQIEKIYQDNEEGIPITPKNDKYLNIIDEAEACSACYSNLVNALKNLHEKGLAEKFTENICIGQAYKGYKGVLGIGDCTSCFEKYLPGCPPDADEMLDFLVQL